MSRGQDADPLNVDDAGLDRRFRAPLMAFFLRRVVRRSEAEDLTQETFLRIVGSKTFNSAPQADAYVFRVATNLLRDRARTANARKHHSPLPFDSASISEIAAMIAEERGPERVLLGRERLDEVLRALDDLGERTKTIFILFRLESMKQKDIAAHYGIGCSTVEKHIMKAVAHLAKRFGDAS